MSKGKTPAASKPESREASAEENPDRRPDYVAVQYRQVRGSDGPKPRREQLGVAWDKAGGGFVFRPCGMQIIQNDVHFYKVGSEPGSQP